MEDDAGGDDPAAPGAPGPGGEHHLGLPEDRRGLVVLAVVVALLVLAAGVVVGTQLGGGDDTVTVPGVEPTSTGFARDATAYEGLGAWIDVFDYAPAYSPGAPPVMAPEDLAAMAAQGVRTLYLQAARLDDRSPDGIVDVGLVSRFLEEAHEHGMRVVAWYLPKLVDVDVDLARVQQLHDLRAGEHRFDGIALDIEDTTSVPDPVERGRRLVDLSTRARALVGGDALGAIVLPPVLTEVVNPAYWPVFPWAEIAGLYDVWLPMAYWTQRRDDSGYKDGFTYVEESVRRLRTDLGKPDALVHPVGGIGDAVTDDQVRAYLRALTATRAIGGSLYDARTTSSGTWALLRAGLPPPAAVAQGERGVVVTAPGIG